MSRLLVYGAKYTLVSRSLSADCTTAYDDTSTTRSFLNPEGERTGPRTGGGGRVGKVGTNRCDVRFANVPHNTTCYCTPLSTVPIVSSASDSLAAYGSVDRCQNDPILLTLSIRPVPIQRDELRPGSNRQPWARNIAHEA